MTKTKLNLIWIVVLVFLLVSKSNSQTNYDITVFGSQKLNKNLLLEKHKVKLDELISLYDENMELYKIKNKEFAEDLKKQYSYSFSNVYLFKSYSGVIDFIIDIVEMEDSLSRLNFRQITKREFEDPDSLIHKWNEYEDLSGDLYEAGEITDIECPVVHCTWSFNHIKLKPYLEYLNTNVPKKKQALIEILNKSNNYKQRANASFLLAHSGITNQEIVNVLMPSIRDSNRIVRNNSMRVIYYACRANPEIMINLDEIINVLDYPSFTDRNKALVVLRSLPLSNLNKTQLKRLLPILIEILVKGDAHNYRNAHTVIKKISGKDYSYSEIEKWKQWSDSIINK